MMFWFMLILWLIGFNGFVVSASNLTATNLFLEQCGVSPGSIPDSIKETGGTSLACAVLQVARPTGAVTTSNSSLYTQEREAHWSSTAWESPSCIFTPSVVEDVTFAVNVLNFTASEYAVRSGGHSPLPFWASIDQGILISMSGITDLSYNDESQTARVGFGNHWGDVYDFVEQFGRLVVGGRVPPVGMALTTGGGLSHLSNKYGFSADNVLAFEVVLANATTVIANATNYSDLFFALKGGSNNFGIVTHMTLKTYPVGKVWGGLVIYNNSYQDQLMSAFASYQQQGQLDEDSALLTYLAINNETVFAAYIYFQPVEKPKAFDAFYSIPALEDLTAIHDNFSDLVNNLNIDYVVPRWTWGTTTIYLDNATYVDVGRICAEDAKQMADINGGSYVLMPQPISESMITASEQAGDSPLGLRLRSQLWFTINIGWNLASDDDKVYAILNSYLSKIESLTKSRNLYDPFLFLNDAASWQSVMESYGSSNVEKLKAVSRLYDPDGMFQYQVPGGFKLLA